MADENSTLENGMNGENGGNATVGTNPRTFTQEEVNELMVVSRMLVYRTFR